MYTSHFHNHHHKSHARIFTNVFYCYLKSIFGNCLCLHSCLFFYVCVCDFLTEIEFELKDKTS